MPTLDSVLRDLEALLAELEQRARASNHTPSERTRDRQAAETLRGIIEQLKRLHADDLD